MAQGHNKKAPFCTYQNGTDRCSRYAVGTSGFCTQHAQPGMSPAAAAEANAFGREVAEAMRQELDVELDVVGQDVNTGPAPDPDDEVPAAARENPIRYAMDMALREVAKAYAEENERRANGRADQPMSPTDRARMTLSAYMPELDDPAAMVDGNGRSLVRPGWIPRWVRDRDDDGRPNGRRLRGFLAQGAEEVLDADGRPLVGRLGRAVQIPPQVYAARVLRHSPSGAFDTQALADQTANMVESVNSTAGRRVLDARPGPEHGSRWGRGG
jgi:hypothetical protein